MNNKSFTPLEMQNETNKLRLPKGNLSLTGFTLLELVVVIVIIGILATLGYNQYALMVEKSRTAEVITYIGTMRQRTYEYYLENGTLVGITGTQQGHTFSCDSTSYYTYCNTGHFNADLIGLAAIRCTAGGKTPDATRKYVYWLEFRPSTGQSTWHCYYLDDGSSCFGMPP